MALPHRQREDVMLRLEHFEATFAAAVVGFLASYA